MSWYERAYRKLFFDFHSPGTTSGLASLFDADQWADRDNVLSVEVPVVEIHAAVVVE